MSLRHRRAVVASAALLVLWGAACDATGEANDAPVPDDAAEAPDTADGSGSGAAPDGEPDGADAEPDGADAEPDGADAEPDGADTGPQVPALLPEVDELDETVVTIATSAGEDVRVDAKVAVRPEERRRGLMEVPELPDGAGMLFLFDEARTGGFWMRNTLVPLDIAYIGEDGRVGTLLAMDPCTADEAADCPVYTPDQPYHAALEVPQGWFADRGVTTGDRVTWTDPVPAG